MAISVGTTYYSSLGTVYNKGGNVTTGYEVRLKYILNSSNKVTNKHSVTSTLQMRATSSSYNTYGNVSATKTVQGVSESLSYLDSWTTSWRDMYSRTFELEANSEGKLTTNLTGSFNISSYAWSASNSALKSASVSESVEFPTIPRKSDVTCPSFNAGDSTNIVISKKDSSFTSTIRYVFGDLSGTIATKTKETVVGWTPKADDFYAQFPDTKQKSGTIYCDTYSGNTLIGTSETSFTCYAKESDCTPDISLVVKDVNFSTKSLTNNENVIIKGMSDVQLLVAHTTKNKATTSKLIVSCGDGQKITNTLNGTLYAVNSGVFTATVTDSRGFSNSTTVEKTVENGLLVDYVKLAITNIDIGRPETTSNIIKANIKGNYYNGNFSTENINSLKLTYRYRETGGEWSSQPVEELKQTINVTEMEEFMGGDITFNLTGGTNDGESYNGTIPADDMPDWIKTETDAEGNLIAKVYIYKTGDYIELTPTISGNGFTFNGELGNNFDYKKQYEFEFYAEDELMYVSASDKPIIVTKGISIIRVGDGYVDIRGDLLQNGKLLEAYPVGSIYMSVNNTNPSTLFGGTWEQLKDRFLLGAGSTYSNGATGGSATHKLTVDEMPSHKHSIQRPAWRYAENEDNGGIYSPYDYRTSSTYSTNTSSVGDSQAHNNMPPYLAVYMWKRTA